MFVLAKFSYFPKGCQIQILDLFEDLEFEIRTFKFSHLKLALAQFYPP